MVSAMCWRIAASKLSSWGNPRARARLESQAPDHTFDQHSFGLPGGSTPSDVDVADLDGDYLDDIVVRAVAAGGEPELWIAHGSASVANLVVTQGPDIICAANSIATATTR